MVETLGWFIDQAWKVLGIFAGLWLFGYIIRNGTGALKAVIKTIGATMKAVCEWIQAKLSKEEDLEGVKMEEESTQKIEIQLTYDELLDLMKKSSTK